MMYILTGKSNINSGTDKRKSEFNGLQSWDLRARKLAMDGEA